MSNEIHKEFALIDELQTSVRLIELGLGEFQNLDTVNDFYFLPFQLLSSGFERLMKCLICLCYFDRNGVYPDRRYLEKKLGHRLTKIKGVLLDEYFVTKKIPALEDDFEYLKNDGNLNKVVGLLEEFGRRSRYYNLDIICGSPAPSIDVKQEWEDYERAYYVDDEELLKKLSSPETNAEVIDWINRQSVILLERWARAIARQFTFSDGEKVKGKSATVLDLVKMSDSRLGSSDYRKKTIKYNQESKRPHRRGVRDLLRRHICSDVRSKTIHRESFDGDWPFYDDEVTIECRHQHWCVVTIDGYVFALNGAAAGRYNLSDVHQAGRAILGKSVGPFIDLALQLGKEQ